MKSEGHSFMIIILIIVIQVYGQIPNELRKWSRYHYPNPQLDPVTCGRGALTDSLICDPDGALLAEDGDDINKILLQLRDLDYECMCCCGASSGYRFAIAMVGKIDSNKDTTTKTIEFADYLRQTSWKYGRCGEDLVMVISLVDETIYTSLGSKTKEILRDNCAKDINQEYYHNLTQGNYSSALKSILTQYRYVLEKQRECNVGPFTIGEIVGIVFASVAGLLLVIGVIVCGCTGHLTWENIKKVLRAAQFIWKVITCQICCSEGSATITINSISGHNGDSGESGDSVDNEEPNTSI